MGNTQTEEQLRLQQEEDEIEIDLKEIFFMLLGNWKIIFLAMLVGAALLGAYHTFLMSPSYEAEASIYITNTDSVVSLSDLQLSSALTDDYAQIIKSRTVLKRVIQELDLDLDYRQLEKLITVNNPDSTHIIEIQVVCDDLETSRNIANALMNVGVEQIYQVIGSSEPTVIDYSEADSVENVTPSLMKYLLIGALAGMILVCMVLVVLMMMDTTMKTEDDIKKYLGLPVLTAVPYYREQES